MDDIALRLLATGAFVLFVAYLLIRRRSTPRRSTALREFAKDRGVKVTEVQRKAIWSQGRYQPPASTTRSFTVAQYSMKNSTGDQNRWSFLQRERGLDPHFPGVWTLECEVGEPTHEQTQILNEIAVDVQWTEEFIEVEFSANDVSIYWDELGSLKAAKKVCHYLAKLATNEPA